MTTIDPHPRDWRFDALTRDELASRAPTATVVLPLGSTEQHGHHLPVRVDQAIVTALAERAAAIASHEVDLLLAPTLPFGFAHHHLPFGGTISIGSKAYVEVLHDIVQGLAVQGFRRVMLLNGHGGNEASMRAAVDRVVFDSRCPLELAATSYWDVGASVLADLDAIPAPGHAGHFETSLSLALYPDLVHLDRRPADEEEVTPLGRPDVPGAVIRRANLWERSDGRTDDARQASVDEGARLVDDLAASIAAFLVRFHRSTGPW